MLRPRCFVPYLLAGCFLMRPDAAWGQQCIEDVFCVIADEHEGVVDFFVDNHQADDLIVIFDVDAENMTTDVAFPHLATYWGNKRTPAFRLRRRHPHSPWRYAYQVMWRKAVNQLGCEQDLFCVIAEETDRFIAVYVENKQPFDLTVELGVDLENAFAEAALPHTATYPANRRTLAFRVQRMNTFGGVRYAYSYRWTYGRLHARHAASTAYALPYAPGKAYTVVQGFDGSFSHQGKYAIDWDLPERTPVRAARAGLVVAVEDRYTEGGVDERLSTKANYIFIQHDDGTIGNYVHLAPNGVFVQVGQRVTQGQTLAVSGNTGYSSGPHLHFEVFAIAEDLHHQTIPIRFLLDESGAVELVEGNAYMAPLR